MTKNPLPLLAIDPGKRALGWAYFGSAGFLVACGVARSAEERTELVARDMMNGLRRALAGMPAAATLIVEEMQVYKGPQQKGDPNDLIALAYVSGGVHVLPDVKPDATLILVKPHAWKGQVPEDIMQKRIEGSLAPLEKQLALASMQNVPTGLRHNGWDAVGIALFGCDRLFGQR